MGHKMPKPHNEIKFLNKLGERPLLPSLLILSHLLTTGRTGALEMSWSTPIPLT